MEQEAEMRLIDADSVKDFFFSETSGTEETISDLAEKHNLTYLNDVNEDEVMSFAKDLLEAVQNVIETEPTAYEPDTVMKQLEDRSTLAKPVGWTKQYEIVTLKDAIEIVKGRGLDKC